MNLLAGDLTPTQGEQRRSHKLRVGRYAQHFVDALRMDETPVEYLLSRFPESGERVCVASSVAVKQTIRHKAAGAAAPGATCRHGCHARLLLPLGSFAAWG